MSGRTGLRRPPSSRLDQSQVVVIDPVAHVTPTRCPQPLPVRRLDQRIECSDPMQECPVALLLTGQTWVRNTRQRFLVASFWPTGHHQVLPAKRARGSAHNGLNRAPRRTPSTVATRPGDSNTLVSGSYPAFRMSAREKSGNPEASSPSQYWDQVKTGFFMSRKIWCATSTTVSGLRSSWSKRKSSGVETLIS